MENQLLIYGLKDPRTGELRYVGKSTKGLVRPESHRKPAKLAKDDTHKARWIRELHGVGLTYEIDVLQYVAAAEELNDAERYWIAEARSNGCRLTNLTDGGDGMSAGAKFSAEHRARISAANKGRRHTPEQRERFMAAVSRRDNSVYAGHVKKMNEARRGAHHTKEAKAKIGAAHRDKYVPPETCARISVAKSKPVRDLTTGAVYPSAKVAGKVLGIEPSGVQYAATGRFRQIKGHRFEYVQ